MRVPCIRSADDPGPYGEGAIRVLTTVRPTTVGRRPRDTVSGPFHFGETFVSAAPPDTAEVLDRPATGPTVLRWLRPLARLPIGGLFSLALLPGLIAAAVLLYGVYATERGQLEGTALQAARGLSLAVERDLAGMRGKLDILATSPQLQGGDFAAFQKQAEFVLATEQLAEAIVLIDGTGQQLVNTLRPYGTALPKTGHPELLRQTFATGLASVSDLYIGGVAKRPFVALEVPVFRGGRVVYALDMGISSERLVQLLEQQHLPKGWIGNVLDSRGVIVARTQNPAAMVGRSATPDLLRALSEFSEGTLASHTLEGTPSFAAFTRSPSSGWTIAVAMTRDALYESLYVHLALAAIVIAAFLGGGALLTWIFSRRVRESLRALETVTAAATRGDLDATAPPGGPPEIARLAERFNRMQRARKDADTRLRLAASVFSKATEGIVIADHDCRIIDVNAAFGTISGFARNEVVGRDAKFLASERNDAAVRAAIFRALRRTGHWHGPLWSRRRDGTDFAMQLTVSAVEHEDGATMRYVGLFSDITDALLHQEEVERLAYRDPLTRLPNRLLLEDRLRNAVAAAKRHATLVAVCYLDLDGFKPINDTHGHEAGDALLREVGLRLERAVRTVDTVARVGGDEFVLLLTDLESEDETRPVLARVEQALAEPYRVKADRTECITASIGVAIYPFDGLDGEALLRHADQAMYAAKRAGRGRVQRFTNAA